MGTDVSHLTSIVISNVMTNVTTLFSLETVQKCQHWENSLVQRDTNKSNVKKLLSQINLCQM